MLLGMPKTRSKRNATASQAARAALIPPEERGDLDARVKALLARNAMLELIEAAREEARLSKRELAAKAGLEESSVRRLLTAKTANPTSENVFRLMGALKIHVEARTPSGKRVPLV
jgi:ribosome-binding protein aMBF1 (putative translation factor)